MTKTEMRDELRTLKKANKAMLKFNLRMMKNLAEACNETYANAREIGELSRKLAALKAT